MWLAVNFMRRGKHKLSMQGYVCPFLMFTVIYWIYNADLKPTVARTDSKSTFQWMNGKSVEQ